jgi:Kef-type K+ transport system membrane component KefB
LAYRCERGVTHQAYNVEGLVSEIGILMLMNIGGFTFTEEKIRKLGEKLNLGEGVCDLCVEFFVKRYTFEAWR